MTFDIVTIFPAMIEAGLAEGVVGRARTRGVLDIAVHDLRAFTTDRHHVVDDVPFGGGPGMVMKAEPFHEAVEAIRARRGAAGLVVMTSPAGRRFDQAAAERMARLHGVTWLCGRYEGVDERVVEERDAHLEAVRHARAVHLREHVVDEADRGVDGHQPVDRVGVGVGVVGGSK